MHPLSRVIIGLTLAISFFAHAQSVFAADRSGSSDHPLIPRFAGSEIIGYKAVNYDEFTLALGKAYEKTMSNYVLEKDLTLEGKITRILYLAPAEKSSLQVFRNYEKAFDAAEFEPMFSCKGNSECGWRAWFTGAQTLGGLRDYALILGGDFRYLSSHLPRKEGDVYISLLVYKYDSNA
ncbi:MAG: DUF4892 domain-containing protein, partial [Gammaproteobacteria bacterium]|nr:DUF4892 domain-containing protein [Gammaproteobacteria bacterium]